MQHLTHRRLVAIQGSAITEAGGHRSMIRLQDDGSYARVPATEGLAIRSLLDPCAPPVAIPVEDCGRVTAIAGLPGNRGFLTGGSDGQIDEWFGRVLGDSAGSAVFRCSPRHRRHRRLWRS